MKSKSILFLLAAVGVVAAALVSCKKASSFNYPPELINLTQILKEDNNNFSYIRLALTRSGLEETVASGEYTLLAPTNAVFSRAGYTVAALQTMNADTLLMLVKNHLIPGRIDFSKFADGQTATALSGLPIAVQRKGTAIYIAGGDITNSNVPATNGIMHVINTVLQNRKSIIDRLQNYNSGASASLYTFVLAAIKRASTGTTNFQEMLESPDADYTFFAPNNGAFIDGGYANLAAVNAAPVVRLDSLLKRHLIAGKMYTSQFDTGTVYQTLNKTTVYVDRLKSKVNTNHYFNGINAVSGSANLESGKSMVHTVARFLPVPTDKKTSEILLADTALSFFNAALQKGSEAAELDFVKMVSDPAASYTVFAVTNNGFRLAGYPSPGSISTASAKVISDMLRMHFVQKRINNINLPENGSLPSLLMVKGKDNEIVDANLTILTSGGYKVKGASNVNSISVTQDNRVTSNGLYNVIGEILTP